MIALIRDLGLMMTKGIQIVDSKDITNAKDNEFVLNTKFAGSIKFYKAFNFVNGGERTLMSTTLGLYAFIQRQNHGLDYVPAYMAFKGYGDQYSPDYVAMPYNNYIAQGGGSDFVNVTKNEIIVGFDETSGADFIRVLIFAEKISDE
jgi:hypothetical protein